MISPRNSTLGEEIYREIDNNAYLHQIYEDILAFYSAKILQGLDIEKTLHEYQFSLDDALRFADLLSKSAGVPNSEKHKSWAQEIVALLIFFCQIPMAYSASICTLSALGSMQLPIGKIKSKNSW